MKARTLMMTMLLAGVAFAADATGKWVANVPGRDGQTREVTFNLKTDGTKLTGTTTGFQGQELQIADGKIEGDSLSFKTTVEFNGNTMVMNYKGKISDDEIKFSQQREGGNQSREFTAKRSK